jgi:hypothetical protein
MWGVGLLVPVNPWRRLPVNPGLLLPVNPGLLLPVNPGLLLPVDLGLAPVNPALLVQSIRPGELLVQPIRPGKLRFELIRLLDRTVEFAAEPFTVGLEAGDSVPLVPVAFERSQGQTAHVYQARSLWGPWEVERHPYFVQE